MTRSGALATVDRRAQERDVPGLLEAARAQPGTRVLVVHDDSVPVADGADRLHFVAPGDVPEGAEWGFLGRDADGAAVLVAAVPRGTDAPDLSAPGWGRLREIGGALSGDEAASVVVAVSLSRWLTDNSFCPGCGSAVELRQAGWSRMCAGCSREIFPRTDPAVIVGVTSADGERILLGANVAWGGRMYSCFAGFVEAGESLEDAVHREIREEAGVRLHQLRYLGSQAWPYPRSLMLGFHATTVADDEAEADGTEILQVRWFTRDEIGRALAGEGDVGLPGPASIAHGLIRAWHSGGS